MLHTVLFVLKIIGISLAILLGIVLVLLSVVLFVPVRYRVEGEKDSVEETEWFRLYFSWLAKLFHGQVVWKDKKLTVDLFLFGIRLKTGRAEKQKKARKLFKKKYTFKEICDMIKSLPKKGASIRDFITSETHHQAFRYLKKESLILWKFLKPKKMDMLITYGADDPYVTGKFLAIMSVIYAWYGDSIDVNVDFTQSIFQGTIFAKGRICLFHVAVFLFRLAFDEAVMKTYHDIEKLANV